MMKKTGKDSEPFAVRLRKMIEGSRLQELVRKTTEENPKFMKDLAKDIGRIWFEEFPKTCREMYGKG